MPNKGFIIVEGATAFCSNAQVFKNKGAAVPMKVISQKKKLGKNKYFAQEKPVATYLDDTADSFNNGQGFVMCQDPKNTSTGYSPCKAKCKIKYKDYYENVEFNKSMKVLLDVSTGTCPGYGILGKIEFATTGQTNNASQIDVKEADEFSVANTSPQWGTSSSTTTSVTSVTSIAMTAPLSLNKPTGVYLYISPPKTNPWGIGLGNSFLANNLTLTAQFKGDSSKIIWALYKGEDTKNKVKTFIGLGNTFNQPLDKIFDNLEEGKYRIEAYGRKAGDKNCAIIIEVIRDFVKTISSIAKSTLVNVPVTFNVDYKVVGLNQTNATKILNAGSVNSFTSSRTLYWRIKQGNTILFNSYSRASSPHLVSANLVANSGIFSFKNVGKYTIEAFTDPTDPKPEYVQLEIKNTLGVMNVAGGEGLLRYNDSLKVQVSGYNVDYVPTAQKVVHWYLKKEGKGRITAFENSALFKSPIINKGVSNFLSQDAQISDVFGKYVLEAYASPLVTGKSPGFTGADCYNFEVIKNEIDKFTLPVTNIPKGTKVKYSAEARISPLAGNESIKLEVPEKVVDNGDGTLTFSELGEYTISAALTGDNTGNKKLETKIKVSDPKIKRALWAYASGVKRTLFGYEEETYGFIEIDGLQNQSLIVKIWVRGENDDFYKEKENYLLEEKKLTLDSEGKKSFSITTNSTYKQKLEKAIPKTVDNPNPQYQIVFTIELQGSSSTDVVLPSNVSVDGTRPIVIDNTTTYLEVLDSNENLTITAEKQIVSIMFATEDGKDIQRTQTFYGKTHKIWVHTVNMTEETLKVDVFKEIPKQALNETNHIIYTHESKQSIKEEKVGKDGLLEVPFTIKDEWKNPPKNFDFYIAQVSRLLVDPADANKHIWKEEKTQLTTNDNLPVDLVRTEDMEKLGIKAHKADGTAFTQEEMLELRKQYIFYESGALKVSQLATPEAIENEVMPVVVEMAEVRKQKSCWCNKPFSDTDLEDLIKTMTGGNKVWQGIKESCAITDKTIASLTREVNAMFVANNINRCMQKMSFLANVSEETGFFVQSKEELSNHLSSRSVYKGRGILQITGVADGTKYYNLPGPYTDYGKKMGDKDKFVGDNADLISTNLHYAVDVGGWMFNYKKVPLWEPDPRKKYSQELLETFKWKRAYFSKGLGKSLNELGLLMEDEEEKYFFLQGKILNGYSPSDRLNKNPNGWENRKRSLEKLKTWFKYDKNVCKGETVLLPELAGGNAPWFKIAWAEYEKYKGLREIDSPLKEKVHVYFTVSSTGAKKENGSLWDHADPWCGAFLAWCFDQTEDYKRINTAYSAQAFGWKTEKWSNGENSDPFVGALIVFDFSHVALIAGETRDGSGYVYLGGNQGNGEKRAGYQKIILGSVSKNSKSILGITKPKKYIVTEEDKKLPKYDVNAENSKESSR